MLTKYILEIDGKDHELSSEDIMNWDEIQCAYKRVDYSGVTRTFTSRFQFVNRAYDLIMSVYLRDGVKTKITLKFYTITDRWEWEKQFEFPLDISSLSWTDYVLNVNCLDVSLAASVKARKNTKYEFVIGQDLLSFNKLNYDRIAMLNMVNHVITGDGDNDINGEYVYLHTGENKLVPTYIKGNGVVYENSPIIFYDQAEGDYDCFIEVKRDVEHLEIIIDINTDFNIDYFSTNEIADIYLVRTDNSGVSSRIATVFHCENSDNAYPESKLLGTYTSLEKLKEKHPTAEGGAWAIIGKRSMGTIEFGSIFAVMPFGNAATDWVISNCASWPWFWNQDDYPELYLYQNKFTFNDLKAGEKISLVYTFQSDVNVAAGGPAFSVKSKIQTSWISRARTISIDAISPESLAKALLEKICDKQIRINPHIADTDARMSKTYILAAESIRALPTAKLYTSFNDFCDWMQAVFGYSYYLGELKKSRFIGSHTFSGIWNYITEETLLNEECPAENISDLGYLSEYGLFAVYNSSNGSYYKKWPATSDIDNWKEYNDETSGQARKDKVFVNEYSAKGYFVNEEFELEEYEGDIDYCTRDEQDVFFAPRSSLYNSENIIEINNVREVQYATNSDFIFSTVVAGYDKQDYQAEGGRDEWNFSAEYTTGIDLKEKKIELKSKYRADCYGIEFLSQERAKDTTDNKSDNTVFFAHCKTVETPVYDSNTGALLGTSASLAIDRSVEISGALTDSVFNGEYSPYRCVKANEGYLSVIHDNCTLKFASFDGNTDVVVDGVRGNMDIQLQNQLFTVGTIEFTTGDIDIPIDPTALYKVSSSGITYYGYLSECTLHYAHTEAIKFKLLVKNIEL